MQDPQDPIDFTPVSKPAPRRLGRLSSISHAVGAALSALYTGFNRGTVPKASKPEEFYNTATGQPYISGINDWDERPQAARSRRAHRRSKKFLAGLCPRRTLPRLRARLAENVARNLAFAGQPAKM